MDRGDPGGGQRTAPNVGRRLAPTGGPPLKDSQGPNWVVLDHVVTFHDLAIENHGGRHGLRSQGLLEQAITRPQRRWYYEGIESLARIAACYTASSSSSTRSWTATSGPAGEQRECLPGETGWSWYALPKTPTGRSWDSRPVQRTSIKRNSWQSLFMSTCGPVTRRAVSRG